MSLKPCPFCGGQRIKAWPGGLECVRCKATGPETTMRHTLEERIEAWNRRFIEYGADYVNQVRLE